MNEQKLKQLFHESTENITLTQEQRVKLISLHSTIKPMTPLQTFLDKEICISMPAFSLATGAFLVAGLLFFHSLLLPGDIPQPKYQIIEMHAKAGDYNEKTDSV